MAILKNGVVTRVADRNGFAVLICDGNDTAFHINMRKYVRVNVDEILFVPISEVFAPDRSPQIGDVIRFAEHTDARIKPSVRMWLFADELLKAQWTMKPPIFRLVEEITDTKSENPQKNVLWEGASLKSAINHLFNRRWFNRPSVEGVRSVTLDSGITVRGWWEHQQWDGSWELIPNPFQRTIAPDREPAMVH